MKLEGSYNSFAFNLQINFYYISVARCSPVIKDLPIVQYPHILYDFMSNLYKILDAIYTDLYGIYVIHKFRKGPATFLGIWRNIILEKNIKGKTKTACEFRIRGKLHDFKNSLQGEVTCSLLYPYRKNKNMNHIGC